MSENEDVPQTPPKKKTKVVSKSYQQKWKEAWKSEPKFAGWLQKSPRSTNLKHIAYCSICSCDISCGKSDFLRHSATQRHKMLSSQSVSHKSVASFVVFNDPVEKAARKIELKLSAFLSEHCLSISLCEPLLALLKNMFPNQAELKRVCLGKQRTSNIIRQVFGKYMFNELCSTLKNQLFSVIIDETTDRSTTNQMTIIVRYWQDNKVKSSFFDLVEVHDATANGLFKALKDAFQTKDIPLQNIVAFCSDTTNTMMGSKHSVSSLLKDELPSVLIIKCSCHLIHLCASYACLKLPKSVEDLCRNVFNHFSTSSKRQDAFKEFQNFVEAEPHKLLAPGQTRWLSLEMCVNRLLEQWDALKLYFTDVALTDPTNTNDAILQELHNSYSIAYLEFLSFNLSRFNGLNTQFQSESSNFHCLKQEICKLVRSICSDCMATSYVKRCDIAALKPSHPLFSASLLPSEKTYLGVAATQRVNELKVSANADDTASFYDSCQQFLIESVKQIQTRFPFDDPIYNAIQCLNPQRAVNLEPPSLSGLFDVIPALFKCADIVKTDEEWRQHYLHETLSSGMSSSEYWQSVMSQTNAAGMPCFPNLNRVVATLLSLPFSNAAAERFFSKLNLIKTNQRTRLKNETITGLMHLIYYMKNNNLTSDLFYVDSKMLTAVEGVKSNATCVQVAAMD